MSVSERGRLVVRTTIEVGTRDPRLMCDVACHMVHTCCHRAQLSTGSARDPLPFIQGLPLRFCARLLVEEGDSLHAVIFLF